MAYERVPVADGTPVVPTAAPQILREDRVIDPYALNKIRLKNQAVPRETSNAVATTTTPAQSGQPIINSEKVAEEPAVPGESVQLSPHVAALARKEQAFRRREQEHKAKEAALEAERAELAELKAFKAKLAAKDFSGVESFVPYDEYTNYLIEKTNTSSPEALALKELKNEVESVKKAQKDDVEKRFEAAVNERRKAIADIVSTSAEYSSVKELKAEEHVLKYMLDTWEKDGVDLTPEQAAQEVEKVILEEAGKWSGLSKLKTNNASTEDEKKQLPPLKTAVKTLTNNMTATGEIARTVKHLSAMSDSERWAEARRRAEEKLKQRGR